jgi:hypothetical protein
MKGLKQKREKPLTLQGCVNLIRSYCTVTSLGNPVLLSFQTGVQGPCGDTFKNLGINGELLLHGPHILSLNREQQRTAKATSHTRLRARVRYTSSTLIGGKGGAGASSLHITFEGPTEYVNAR